MLLTNTWSSLSDSPFPHKPWILFHSTFNAWNQAGIVIPIKIPAPCSRQISVASRILLGPRKRLPERTFKSFSLLCPGAHPPCAQTEKVEFVDMSRLQSNFELGGKTSKAPASPQTPSRKLNLYMPTHAQTTHKPGIDLQLNFCRFLSTLFSKLMLSSSIPNRIVPSTFWLFFCGWLQVQCIARQLCITGQCNGIRGWVLRV